MLIVAHPQRSCHGLLPAAPGSSGNRAFMSKKSLLLLIGVLTLAVIVLAWRNATGDARDTHAPAVATRSGPAGAPTAAPALKVYAHRVTPRPLAETISSNGTLLANEAIEVRSEVDGRVVEIAFDEGRRVKAGDLLVKINASELQAQLRRTLARVELARTQEGRQRQLFEGGGTSRDVLDTAINEVRVLEAEAELIRAQLEKMEVRAPFDGIVGRRFISLGSYLTSNTTIATLQNVDQLKIDFAISERYMDRVHPGTAINFRVSGRTEKFPGTVYAVEPSIDIATRTVILRARATNPNASLLPGAYAYVEIILDEIPDALLVPTTAIIPGLDGRTVYVVENGRAQPRTVETGTRLDREIHVLAGLQPGDLVITSGLLQLRAGAPVEPIAEDGSPLRPPAPRES
jgi:membrane fusion protein (multidrug efflux system)